jgi:hypothetical protein
VERTAVFLMMLLGAAPVLLAVLLGGVLALLLWRRAPRPALLVLLACAGQFAVTLFSVWLSGWWIPAARAAGETSVIRLSHLMGIWGVCASLLHGVLIGLLIWAAFAGRPRAVPPPLA